jgi:hypothetical protein
LVCKIEWIHPSSSHSSQANTPFLSKRIDFYTKNLSECKSIFRLSSSIISIYFLGKFQFISATHPPPMVDVVGAKYLMYY